MSTADLFQIFPTVKLTFLLTHNLVALLSTHVIPDLYLLVKHKGFAKLMDNGQDKHLHVSVSSYVFAFTVSVHSICNMTRYLG